MRLTQLHALALAAHPAAAHRRGEGAFGRPEPLQFRFVGPAFGNRISAVAAIPTVKLAAGGVTRTQPFEILLPPDSHSAAGDSHSSARVQLELRDDINSVSDMTNQIEWMRRQLEDQQKSVQSREALVECRLGSYRNRARTGLRSRKPTQEDARRLSIPYAERRPSV